MLFSKFSAVVFGIASIATASPINNLDTLAAREASPVERGLVWRPRSAIESRNPNRGGNNKIIIAQPVNIQLTQIQIIQQVQIVNVIQNIILIDNGNRFRDNIRRNHFKNQNKGRNVNIVIIIVQVVIDVRNNNGRDNGKRNERYLTRQVESNPEFASKEYAVVTDRSTMTVDSQATGTAASEGAFATGAPSAGEAPGVKDFDINAPLDVSKDALLLPEGQAAPRWESQASQHQDPAIILEKGVDAFVSFV